MTKEKQSQSEKLREYGVTLAYLARFASRTVGYVKLWSSGQEKSKHLDEKAAELIQNRQAELAAELAKGK
ncbi:hypothetical protein [Hymenobacter glacieicola]|uniref:Uncharacterized protein n=1 Tax=Hymenobacter glacieicola TaxID=1562124 RepID=A0ABQ1WJG3_9BACT|nr:hypothetical protein [Hymenobacter glacieicola]GGG33213.1 hypothetical protein GCM10011378_07030 [Hymenobacter glacieicola]